jgi:hypothetical protein
VPRPRGAHPVAAARGRVCGAGGRGAGEKEARARAVTPGCRGAEHARELAGDTSEPGLELRQKGKGKARRLELPVMEQGDVAETRERRPGSRATARGRGKLTGGTRPSAAPGEGKVKGRDTSRRSAGPWSAAVSRGLCFTGEKKEGSGPSSRAGGLST